MARDILHSIVKEVLTQSGWTITHDPYQMKDYDPAWEIDFAAERIFAAERDAEKIAVEVKSFTETSFAHEFHSILGQYFDYRSGLKRLEPERKLFLAVPVEIWETEFQRLGIVNALSDYEVKVFVYDPIQKNILSWRP
jgi:hypothetical protein